MLDPAIDEQLLVLGHDVVVRPISEGCLAVVGDRQPEHLDRLGERILAVCVRPTERGELIELLCELDRTFPADAATAIDDLLRRSFLRPS